ncbi:DUF554 domain-containing protein [Caldisericum exile]|uniref:Hypothetical membrane protein n=1 Tax=Caldisericum exile (strain DSM 21853 / NBRC 104410 / AZM16c01) TaxID=511051 RepID=A0A7U6JGM5_CALEA|nr:DUF554 domain-containing protein [Caldisericum exile]BAL80467.1 hypothetical membrane protein [Caldisericum exile AZM16c01]
MKGTIVNVITVLVGSTLGLIIGERFPERVKHIVIQSIGLFTILIGITMIIKSTKFIEIFLSLILGSITGELLRLNEGLEHLMGKIKSKISPNSPHFVEGFITATLVFCVGAMTVVGSIQEGLTGDATLLITKSIMDGITSLTLASGLGIGVMFSAISVFVIQGSLTLLGSRLLFLTQDVYINNFTGLGGVLILAIGIELLNIQKIKILNMLPSLVYLPFVIYISSLL